MIKAREPQRVNCKELKDKVVVVVLKDEVLVVDQLRHWQKKKK